jgi:hypothetical protein
MNIKVPTYNCNTFATCIKNKCEDDTMWETVTYNVHMWIKNYTKKYISGATFGTVN